MTTTHPIPQQTKVEAYAEALAAAVNHLNAAVASLQRAAEVSPDPWAVDVKHYIVEIDAIISSDDGEAGLEALLDAQVPAGMVE